MASNHVKGKGTKDFEAYVRNLQRALWLNAIGAQLAPGDGPRIRGPMVHNPYSLTIADLNICNVRAESSQRQ